MTIRVVSDWDLQQCRHRQVVVGVGRMPINQGSGVAYVGRMGGRFRGAGSSFVNVTPSDEMREPEPSRVQIDA